MALADVLRSEELRDRVHAAVWALRDEPVYGDRAPSVSAIMRAAVLAELDRLEREYGGGRPFPTPPRELKHRPGRPRELGDL